MLANYINPNIDVHRTNGSLAFRAFQTFKPFKFDELRACETCGPYRSPAHNSNLSSYSTLRELRNLLILFLSRKSGEV